jgi:hypothetical protein
LPILLPFETFAENFPLNQTKDMKDKVTAAAAGRNAIAFKRDNQRHRQRANNMHLSKLIGPVPQRPDIIPQSKKWKNWARDKW